MLEGTWGTAEGHSSLWEKAPVCVIFSPSHSPACFLPPFSLQDRKQQIQGLDLQAGYSGWKISLQVSRKTDEMARLREQLKARKIW